MAIRFSSWHKAGSPNVISPSQRKHQGTYSREPDYGIPFLGILKDSYFCNQISKTKIITTQ
jgi:hypothetical protein